MAATKATVRNGRAGKNGVFNANHNTLKKTRDMEAHIDHSRTEQNKCYYWDSDMRGHTAPSFNAKKRELEVYESLYAPGLEAKNGRYKKEGHSERCRTIEDVYSSPKTAPLETIFQVGKKGSFHDPQLLWQITLEAINDVRKAAHERCPGSGNCFRPLTAAIHVDETTDHVHFRATLMAKDADCNWVPNQSAALKAMGFERPDLSKPQGKYNSPLISFSDALRQAFYARCREHGIEIDDVVRNPSQRHKDSLEHQCSELEQQCEALTAEKASLSATVEQQASKIQEQAQMIENSQKELLAAQEAQRTLLQEQQLMQLRCDELEAKAKETERKLITAQSELTAARDETERQALRAESAAKAAETFSAKSIKKAKRGETFSMNICQFQEATSQTMIAKRILEDPIYTSRDVAEAQRAEERYNAAAAALEAQRRNEDAELNRRVDQRVALLDRTQPREIAKLNKQLTEANLRIRDFEDFVDALREVVPIHQLREAEIACGVHILDDPDPTGGHNNFILE